MDKIKKIVKDDPKDRIEVEVGDFKQPDWHPQVKLMRWDNEVNLSVRHEGGQRYDFYDVPNGYEFEVVYDEKPTTNKVRFTVNHKELDFFYQPELTQQEIDDGAFRPDDVVGSYAVYHKTKGGLNRADGMDYKTGKAFHIYRPFAHDAEGNGVWCELKIAGANMTITVPQIFLDDAVYPVVVDPTFGYTTAGASKDLNSTGRTYGLKATLSEAGDVSKISTYMEQRFGGDAWGRFYDITGDYDYQGSETSATAISGTAQWFDLNFSPDHSLSSDTYYITHRNQDGRQYYDTGGSTGDSIFENGYAAQDPWEGYTESTNLYSIYATYTASGADYDINTNDSVTITENTTVTVNAPTPISIDVNDSVTVSEDTTPEIQAGADLEINVGQFIHVVDYLPRKGFEELIVVGEGVGVLLLTEITEYNRLVYDDVTVTEDVSVLVNELVPTSSEDITITEDITVRLVSYIDASEDITTSEDTTVTISAIPTLSIDVNDSVTITENISVILTSYVSESEDISVSEDSTTDIVIYVDQYDTVNMTDELPFYHPEDITVTESVSATVEDPAGQLSVDVNDSITLTENTTVSVQAPVTPEINVSDSITITEDLTVTVTNNVSASEDITTTEDVSIDVKVYVSSSEEITITEDTTVDIQAVPALTINVNDSVTITEDTIVIIPTIYVDVNEDISITESSEVALLLVIDVNDDIAVTEDTTIAQVGTLNVSVYEAIGGEGPTIIYDDKINPLYKLSRDLYFRL